jgi:hypothetical protein
MKLLGLISVHFSATEDPNSAFEYGNRKVKDSQVGLKLNGTHQLLACADDMNVMGGNVDTIKKNTRNFN